MVCTANQCRSPMGEVLLRRHLDARDVVASVSSAGVLAEEGLPPTDDAIATMAERGLDIASHLSRLATPAVLSASDLIVTMTAHQVAEVAVALHTAWPRTFPLRDLVRRMERASRDPDWILRLGERRTSRDVLASPVSDDVEDPIGSPRAVYDQVAEELDELMGRLATRLAILL